ncbi:MAG: hypothetical protein U0Q22_15225 [Acidimicrobiales bacterium]
MDGDAPSLVFPHINAHEDEYGRLELEEDVDTMTVVSLTDADGGAVNVTVAIGAGRRPAVGAGARRPPALGRAAHGTDIVDAVVVPDPLPAPIAVGERPEVAARQRRYDASPFTVGIQYPEELASAPRASRRDRFGFDNRTCASFVAVWLEQSGAIDLNHFGGVDTWGCVASWHAVAERLGYAVGGQPRVGAVAQSSAGFGHVGVVVAGDDAMVTIADYDYALDGERRERTVPTATYRYIELFAPRHPTVF